MDKYLDFRIYQYKCHRLWSRTSSRIIQTRILKLYSSESKDFYETIGTSLLDSQQFEKSLIPLKRAIIINPDNSKAQIGFATALFKLEREDEAFSSIKRAISLSIRTYNLQNFLAKSLEERNRLQEAESFCQEIAKMITDPESIAILYFEMAEALVRNDHYLQSLENYKRAIETNTKEDSHHYYQYGMALYHESFFEESIVQFEHAKRLAPSDPRACNNIAFMSYCLGKVEKALEEFESLIKNGLVLYATYSNFILVLHHLDKGEEEINKYKDLFLPYVQRKRWRLDKMYNEELRQAQLKLEGEIDEETRGFYEKKLKGINFILSLLK